MNAERPYLGKLFIPFGDTSDEDVVASLSLTSANDVGNATVSAGTFDSTRGFLGGTSATTGYLEWVVGSTDLVPSSAIFNEGFTVSFELETAGLLAENSTSVFYPIMFLRDGSAIAGWIKVQAQTTNLILISYRATNGTESASVRVSLNNKSDFMRIDLSFRKCKVDMFVDYCWMATFNTLDMVGVTNMTTIRVGGWPSATFNYPFYVRNLQVVARPMLWAPSITLGVSRIAYVGDSVLAHGNWYSDVNQKWIGTATGSAGQHYDSGSAPECHRWFAERGLNVEVLDYAVPSTTVIATGALDIIDQVDGTGAYDALDNKPDWVVFLGGFNDINTGGDPDLSAGQAFDLAYRAILDQIVSRSPDSKILCLNHFTRNNSTTYGTADEQTETDSMNDLIASIVADYNNAYLGDLFTEFGGHAGYDSADFDANDFHLSEQGSKKLGVYIATRIAAIEGLAI